MAGIKSRLLLSWLCITSVNIYSQEIPIDNQIKQLTSTLTQAEKSDDLTTFLSFYDPNIISMPEFQPELNGVNEVEAYYKEIFGRQRVQSFRRQTNEIVNLGQTLVETGSFEKKLTTTGSDSLLTLNGKYIHVWGIQPDGKLRLKGEAYGFFHPVKNPGIFVVPVKSSGVKGPDQNTTFELRAYNALMEKLVRNGEGALRSEFYTADGMFMPFAHPNVLGKDIRPYLIKYDTHPQGFNIDSIWVYTHHYEYFNNYVLEYSKFKVKWSFTQTSGRTEGKGIRLWKRQEDKSLRLYREIGTHNHL